MTYVCNNENTVNHLQVFGAHHETFFGKDFTETGQFDPWPYLSPLCLAILSAWIDMSFLLLCSSGPKQLGWVCSSSLSFAAPTQGKLKSFCAPEKSDLAASGRFHTDDVDLLPAAERNLSKLILYNAQIPRHLSSEMEKPSEGRKQLGPAGPSETNSLRYTQTSSVPLLCTEGGTRKPLGSLHLQRAGHSAAALNTGASLL